jgi:hypothetical protein
MNMPAFDINAAVAAAAAIAPDMNVAKTGGGGGEYVPPAAGPCIVTLVGYIEKGIQHVPASKFDPIKFPAKDVKLVDLIFEISGKGHEAKEHEGKFYPERLTVEVPHSLNEKAWFYKIFKALNYDKSATHMAQLLGKHFISRIEHSVPKKEGDRVYASLKQKQNGYVFNAPVVENPATGESMAIPKPVVHSAFRLFLWDVPSKEMWDSLYIDGTYPAKIDEKTKAVIYPERSKNVIQQKILQAVNFAGSPLADIIGEDALLELPETDAAELAASTAEVVADLTAAAQPDEQAQADALADLVA